MERTRNPTEMARAEEPELPRAGPGAGAGASSLGTILVVGAPGIAVGDNAEGEIAAAKSIMHFSVNLKIYLTQSMDAALR